MAIQPLHIEICEADLSFQSITRPQFPVFTDVTRRTQMHILVMGLLLLLSPPPTAKSPKGLKTPKVQHIAFCGGTVALDARRVECYSGLTVPDLSILARLPNLTELEIVEVEHPLNLALLAKLTKLTVLNLRETNVTDLAPLARLTNLRFLNLHATPVTDLSPLAGLKRLKELRISITRVSDLGPIASLELESLLIWGSDVRDVTPLVKMTSLTYLDASEILEIDLSPLAGRPGLKIMD